MLTQTTGLPVQCYLRAIGWFCSRSQPGWLCDEVDLVLFFRDPLHADSTNVTEQNLLRLCGYAQCSHCHQHCHRRSSAPRVGSGDLDYREAMHPQVIDPFPPAGLYKSAAENHT